MTNGVTRWVNGLLRTAVGLNNLGCLSECYACTECFVYNTGPTAADRTTEAGLVPPDEGRRPRPRARAPAASRRIYTGEQSLL